MKNNNNFHTFVKKTLAERKQKFKIVKTKGNELALFPSSFDITIGQVPYGSDSQEGILQEFFNKIDLTHMLGACSPISISVKNRLLKFISNNYILVKKHSDVEVKCRVYEEGILNWRNEIVCNQHKKN